MEFNTGIEMVKLCWVKTNKTMFKLSIEIKMRVLTYTIRSGG